MTMYYGLVVKEHAIDIVEKVCEVLGGGAHAECLLLEVAQQETLLGSFRDTTDYAAGTGLTQFDEKPFYDIIRRTRPKHKRLIRQYFDIDIDKVKWNELEHNPLIAFIMTRLFFKLIPEAIPNTLEGRAQYWKTYYNTDLGKGEVEEYIENGLELHEWLVSVGEDYGIIKDSTITSSLTFHA